MPLRSFRFYLSDYLHYYGHIRLPRLTVRLPAFVRVSHVHALPYCCTQHHFTPGTYQCAYCRCFHWYSRFHQFGQFDRYHLWCFEALLFQLTTSSRLSFTMSVSGSECQTDFNLNGKLSCMALSSI